jgi:hypothetical protein
MCEPSAKIFIKKRLIRIFWITIAIAMLYLPINVMELAEPYWYVVTSAFILSTILLLTHIVRLSSP